MEIFTISKDQTRSLRDRLSGSGQPESGIEEVKKMIDIKSTLLWRADYACACVGNGPMNSLYAEVQILENVLDAMENGDGLKAAAILDEYLEIMI